MVEQATSTDRAFVVDQLKKLAASAEAAVSYRGGSFEQRLSRRSFVVWSTIAITNEWNRDRRWRESLRSVREAKGVQYARDLEQRVYEVAHEAGILFQKADVSEDVRDNLFWIDRALRRISAEFFVIADEVEGECKEAPSVITLKRAIDRFQVANSTLRKAVKDGKLTDHRPHHHPANGSLLLDEREIASRYPRR